MFKKKTNKICKMQFVMDKHGKEVLLKDDTFQVMMEWEKPYMEACVDALKPFGDVLEIGFGCGYSATHIQKYKPRSHTIIEYHPLVIEKAKEFAKKHKGVKIVEGTWQDAIEKLGVFDCVFFDDYPLESLEESKFFQSVGEKAHHILEKGQKLLKKVQDQLSFLKDIKYKDNDLDYFFNNLKNKSKVDPTHYLPFFAELKKKGNITEEQFDRVIKRLEDEKLITFAVKQSFLESLKNRENSAPFDESHRSDRLFEFLKMCLDTHMRKGSRFSCYLDRPNSKYDDEMFFNHVITNPELDYKEHVIDVDVPDNCEYYPYKEALVIIITKMV